MINSIILIVCKYPGRIIWTYGIDRSRYETSIIKYISNPTDRSQVSGTNELVRKL